MEPVVDGTVALGLTHGEDPFDAPPQVQYTDQLGLLGQLAFIPPGAADQVVIVQIWKTSGPEGEGWRRYQIQSALLDDSGEQLVQASDALRFVSTEWPRDGVFITWQALPWPDQESVAGTALRLSPQGERPLQPPGSGDGWVSFPLVGPGIHF
jgi:hypothetical protein